MTSVDIVETLSGSVETEPTNNPNLKQRRSSTTTWHLRNFDVVTQKNVKKIRREAYLIGWMIALPMSLRREGKKIVRNGFRV